MQTKSKSVILATLLVCVLLLLTFGFTACEQNYSALDIKNNLKNAGYTVSEGEKIQFADDTDTTTLAGLQKIYFVNKGTGANREYGVFLVFDSITNANKLSDAHMIEISEGAKQNCGANKDSDMKTGKFCNVVFGGYTGIYKASNIS